jgi:uncharacterized protein (DUF2062 family)
MIHLENRYTNIPRSLKKIYERFLRIRGQPREIALGLALGLFIGMTPSMGIQTAIAVFLAVLFKWNKFSAAIGAWITNPLTAPFIYSFNYLIGARLLEIKRGYSLPTEIGISRMSQMLHKAPEVFWALILGGAILGLPLAVSGYYFSYSAITRYQERIKKTIARQREKLAIKRKMRRKKVRREYPYSKAHRKSKP